MRVVFIGSGEMTVETAKLLLKRDHEVVIIEHDRDRIDELSDLLDCGFLNGDAAKPGILREAGPEQTDVLFCLTEDDRTNIIAALAGKQLGFRRVVPRVQETDYLDLCRELGLEDTVVPSRTIGRFLADFVGGPEVIELSTIIKGQARFFSFKIDREEAGSTIAKLELPRQTRAVCLYRGEEFKLPDGDTKLADGDELVLVTHSRNMPELLKRWGDDASRKESSKEEAQE